MADLDVGQVWEWRGSVEKGKRLHEVYLTVNDEERGVWMVILYTNWRGRGVGDRMRVDKSDPWFFNTHTRLL